MAEIVGVILTHDEAANVVACIESLRWLDRVVVFDSYSEDETRALASEAGADVLVHAFENYAQQRNAALEQVEAEWVFFVDADERATPELAAEVRRAVQEVAYRGWWVPRHNYIFGRLTRYAGWYPDHQLRLLHRASARYDPAREVHEVVQLDGEAGYLENPLIHYNYENLAEFLTRQRLYSQIDAEARHRAGERPRLRAFLTVPLRHFWWRFVTLNGYRGGLHGFLLCILMAYFTFDTWRRLAKINRLEARKKA